MSELDFETDDEDEDEDDEEAEGADRPQKKHKGGCAHGCKH
jgi:hypothetical protein